MPFPRTGAVSGGHDSFLHNKLGCYSGMEARSTINSPLKIDIVSILDPGLYHSGPDSFS